MGNVATFFLYAGTQMLISALSGKKKNDPTRAQDFTPTTLSSQGGFVPLLIGRRRIGALAAWAGDRQAYPVTTRVQSKGSKKKNKSTGEINYVEAGWHLLCIGPALKLFKIYEDGKVIYDTEIDSVTTPSGSTLTTLNGDTFRIFWGEEDQDVNTFLGDASRVGISSRWPFHCYVEWTAKNLGPSPRWRLLDYDLEVAVQYETTDPATLTSMGSDPVVISRGFATSINDPAVRTVPVAGRYVNKPNLVLSLARNPLHANPEPEFVGPIEVLLDGTTVLSIPSGNFRVNSSVAAPFTFREISSTLWVIEAPITVDQVLPTSFYRTVNIAAINSTGSFPTGTNAGYSVVGGIATLADTGIDCTGEIPAGPEGPNGAYVIGQVLFSAFPHGLGLDEDLFDLTSLATLATLLEGECSPSHLWARDGEEAVTSIASLMQDCGVFIYREPSTGLLTFKAIRQEASPAAIPEELVTDFLPEVEVIHEDNAGTRLVFDFSDLDRAFRETTITIDEDGVADRLSHHRARKVQIPTAIEIQTANKIAERRSQEEFGGTGAIRLKLNRGALGLYPGQVVEVEGIDGALRVVEVHPDGIGSVVEVKLVPDAYGAEASTFETDGGAAASSGGTPVAADEQYTILEVPQHLLEGGPPAVVVPRVRAHDQIAFSTLHLSADGTTYVIAATEFEIGTGGELLDAIAADDAWEIGTGPEVELLGVPDDDVVDDLTADETSWRMGRQVVAIGGELFFLRKLVAVSGSTYRLDGLIRARYDTDRAAHSIGAEVYVFRFDEITAIGDPLLAPGATLYVKSQPSAASALALGSVTAVSKTLYGKGLVPPPPCALRVTAPRKGSATYRTGEDVTFAWASRIASPPEAGMGLHGIGTQPVGVGALPANTVFEVKVYDSGDLLVATYEAGDGVTSTGWTYANADLQTDLGGETDFSIEVRQIQAGYRSSANTLAVTAL